MKVNYYCLASIFGISLTVILSISVGCSILSIWPVIGIIARISPISLGPWSSLLLVDIGFLLFLWLLHPLLLVVTLLRAIWWQLVMAVVVWLVAWLSVLTMVTRIAVAMLRVSVRALMVVMLEALLRNTFSSISVISLHPLCSCIPRTILTLLRTKCWISSMFILVPRVALVALMIISFLSQIAVFIRPVVLVLHWDIWLPKGVALSLIRVVIRRVSGTCLSPGRLLMMCLIACRWLIVIAVAIVLVWVVWSWVVGGSWRWVVRSLYQAVVVEIVVWVIIVVWVFVLLQILSHELFVLIFIFANFILCHLTAIIAARATSARLVSNCSTHLVIIIRGNISNGSNALENLQSFDDIFVYQVKLVKEWILRKDKSLF